MRQRVHRAKALFGLVGLFIVMALVLAACEGSEGPQGPAGERGPKGDTGAAGPAGSSPSAAEIQAAVEAVIGGAPASAESIARGGRLYDKWWKEAGVSEPSGDNPLWALQTTNTRSGSSTWRCKECHGWDYKGAGGHYSSGSHFSGFSGVISAGATMSKEDLLGVMQGSQDYRHDFSGVMSAGDLDDIVNFLSEGLVNHTPYFDYTASGKPPVNPDLSNGETLYTGTCVMCHGADGKQIPIDGMGIGEISRDEPTVEILHKIWAGQPGTSMPSAIAKGWSVQDAVDVLAHVQTLP